MSIVPVFASLDPEVLDYASKGYEIARANLGLRDRADPLTEVLAIKVLEVVQAGESDPDKIAQHAIAALGSSLQKTG